MSAIPNASPATFDADTCVGIVVALPEELATLTSAKLKQGECRRLGNLRVAYAGAGFDNAASAAKLLADQGIACLISWGCAAGLAPDMQPGDLLLASQIDNGSRRFDTDNLLSASLRQRLPAGLKVHGGKLYSCNRLVADSAEKQGIHQQTQALGLDMESAAIADFALRAKLPFMAIRAIADPVGQTLPRAVVQALNAQGRVELPRLLRYLLWHPLEVKALIQLGLHFSAAQKTLKLVARQLSSQSLFQPQAAN